MTSPSTSSKPKRPQDSPEVAHSKALSYILRHGAAKEHLKIRDDGFILVEDILRRPKLKGLDLDGLRAIVQNNEKQRFTISEEPGPDGTPQLWIRANQGHSIKVKDLDLEQLDIAHVQTVIHGTYLKTWPLIEKEGLKVMTRTHIHCAPGLLSEEGVISGMRKSCNVFIYIDALSAMQEGITFFRSKNGVILTEGQAGVLPPKYFKKVVTKRGELLLGDTNSAPDPSNLPKERNVQPLLSETPASDRTDLGVEAPVAALKLERDEGSNTSS